MKNVTAEIRWFDARSGEGMVRLSDGKCIFMHFTAIQGIDKNNMQWPTDQDQATLMHIAGKRCIVDVHEDLNWSQVESCFIPEMRG